MIASGADQSKSRKTWLQLLHQVIVLEGDPRQSAGRGGREHRKSSRGFPALGMACRPIGVLSIHSSLSVELVNKRIEPCTQSRMLEACRCYPSDFVDSAITAAFSQSPKTIFWFSTTMTYERYFMRSICNGRVENAKRENRRSLFVNKKRLSLSDLLRFRSNPRRASGSNVSPLRRGPKYKTPTSSQMGCPPGIVRGSRHRAISRAGQLWSRHRKLQRHIGEMKPSG